MSRIDLEQQRRRAKDLRRAHAAGSAEATARVAAHLPGVRGRLALSQAQVVVAREAGFASWPALVHHVRAERAVDVGEAALDAALAGDAAAIAVLRARDPALASRSIHVAAALADAAAVSDQLARDPALASRPGGRRGWPPLLYLCCAGLRRDDGARVDIARQLIELGADVDADGPEGGLAVDGVGVLDEARWRPIEGAAARAVDPALVDALLAAGADLRPTTAVVTRAVTGNEPAIVRAVLAADPPWWQLIWALVACVELDRPAMARLVMPHLHSAKSGEPALVEAIRRGRDRELVEVLIGDAPTTDAGRAVHERGYREAVRHDHRAALDRLRALGTADVLRPVDRLIGACVTGDAAAAGPIAEVELDDDDHRMVSWAVRTGRFAAVPRLIAAGLDPGAPDRDGETPLHLAIRADAIDTVDALIAAGAPVDARNFDGRTPLDLADPAGPIAARLRAAGAHEPEAPPSDDLAELFERTADAVAFGEVETLRELLDDEPALIHARSPRAHRCTLLHYVGANGTESPRQRTPARSAEIAALLLERGADPNAQCKLYGGGSTTLGLVLTSVFPPKAGLDGELVAVLARFGARIATVAGHGPIITAIHHGLPRAAAALLAAGVPVDTLYIAAGVGRLDVLADLLAAGADVDQRFADGYTALHAAASMNQRAAIELLLARGADRTIRDTRWNNTPADTARHYEFPDLVALLA